MRHIAPLFCLALTAIEACGTEPMPVPQASTAAVGTVKLLGVTPGTYGLHMVLAPEYPAQTYDRTGTFTGCPATFDAKVNVSQVDGVPDVAYASDPNTHLEVQYQDRVVQYLDQGDTTLEYCRGVDLPVHRMQVVTFDTLHLTGIASFYFQHPCADAPEQCVYAVTAERL